MKYVALAIASLAIMAATIAAVYLTKEPKVMFALILIPAVWFQSEGKEIGNIRVRLNSKKPTEDHPSR